MTVISQILTIIQKAAGDGKSISILLAYLLKEKFLPDRIISKEKEVSRGFHLMIKKAPPSVVYDFARQVWLIVKPKEEWIYHGDLMNIVKPKEIVCKCAGFGKGKIDLYEFDQMYGVGRCMECSTMHWYNLI